MRLGSNLLMLMCWCAAACGGGDQKPDGPGRGSSAGGAASAGRAASVAGASGSGTTAGAAGSATTGGAGSGATAAGSGKANGAGSGAAAAGSGKANGAPPRAGAPAADGGSGAPASLADCPAAPADAPAGAVAALNAVNALRVAAGAACVTLNMQIVQAATAHCAYYQTNNQSNPMCTSNPHGEVTGCTGFTGANPLDRMRAAGFTSNGGSEVMAFVNSPERSVQTWVDSVWHRIPILDPATTVMGYGAAGSPDNCDTIDFGPSARTPATTVLVYPYDGQTGVTTSFNGQYEGPMPPAPSTGWPSSNPITLYAQKPMITEHVLTVDGSTEPIDHVFLDSSSSMLDASDQQFLRSSVFLYANEPFMPMTKYHVKISGTYAGGMLMKEWSFTTGAAAPTRGGMR
jgi:uncharacterized protein YkwD